MASSASETDLIDFAVGSPDILTSPLRQTSSDSYEDLTSDNLLDSELQTLEERLQTAADAPPSVNHDVVDVEDILISIDDELESIKIERRAKDVDDNEVLSVLEQLDQVLNDSLGDDCNAEEEERLVRMYLAELDSYLKMVEAADNLREIKDTSSETRSIDGESITELSGDLTSDFSQNSPSSISQSSSRNSSRFPAGFDSRDARGLRKSSSIRSLPCDAIGEPFRRSEAVRSTVPVATSPPKVSETPGGMIRQSVENELEGNPVPEPAGGDRELEEEEEETRTEEMQRVPQKRQETLKDVDRSQSRWLRSSMRRLRHLRLPSDSTDTVAISNLLMVTSSRASEEETAGEDNGGLQGDDDDEDNDVDRESRDEDVQIDSDLRQRHPTGREETRPMSAPSRLIGAHSGSGRQETAGGELPGGRARTNSSASRSRRHRSPSSSESSIATTVDTTPSCTPVPSPMRNSEESVGGSSNPRRTCERPRTELPEVESPLGHWPHSLSSMLACLSCSLGLFNICRFAVLSIHFGANFIFQFFILSMVVGLPMFTLQLCLGQQLGAGVIDMWRISPLFQGVGVSLLISQALVGLYSITGVSWMFVYFRDSFITKMDKYRWAEPFSPYRRDQPMNMSLKLSDTVPDYLSGVVYQRTNLVYGNVYGTIKFQPAFNLAVVWMIVFVSLSKGLRSYGKVVFVFTLLPVFAMFILCAKLLGMMPPEYIHVIFPETSWGEFFLNSKSWIAAGQETFLTWGLLSAAVMQLASHNKNKHLLQRDSSLIAVLTFSILLLVAFLANTCIQILHSYGYTYQPNSFEKLSTYTFLRPLKEPLPPNLASTPIRYMGHNSYILGERVTRPGMDTTTESGYQVLRFATEMIPATFALLGTERISPFWAVLFYFILILFGIAQQLAVWHCVITGIMAIKAKVLKSWETTITFFSCACGFILGLPMTTELGIYVVYFLDVTIGGLWWLILVILLQIIAVFMVRGRPYSGDTVVMALFKHSSPSCVYSWAPALLSFVWNVILPVVLMILCVAFFKNGNFRQLFVWHHAPSVEYWPLWARQMGSMIQLLPVLCVPIVAVIQSYRYLNNGPPDILDRIQYLYRPPLGEHMDNLAIQEIASTILATSVVIPEVRAEDPPPKYTPPPSYTTATGARLAKFLRQSIRRSVRRLANVLGEGSSRHNANNLSTNDPQQGNVVPPPDYNAVLVEMNQTLPDNEVSVYVTDASSAQTDNLTAAQVASILRSSFRRSGRRNESGTASLSAENLVDSAAPIGETSLIGGTIQEDKTVHNTVI